MIRHFLKFVALGTLVAAISAGSVFAATVSQEISQSGDLPLGTLVSINEQDTTQVVLANSQNGQYLFGVVTQQGSSLAELGTSDEGTQIATNGDVSVIVTNADGDIQKGDVLSVSDVTGIAGKVTTRGGTTLGIALADFNDGTDGGRQVATQSIDGEKQITVGTIPVRLAINDFYIEQFANSNILQSTGERLVGKPVGIVQAAASGIIALTSIIIGGYTIYAAVSGSFISVGRNPLSGTAVFSGLFYVTLVAIAIVMVGLVASYLILLI